MLVKIQKYAVFFKKTVRTVLIEPSVHKPDYNLTYFLAVVFMKPSVMCAGCLMVLQCLISYVYELPRLSVSGQMGPRFSASGRELRGIIFSTWKMYECLCLATAEDSPNRHPWSNPQHRAPRSRPPTRPTRSPNQFPTPPTCPT